MLIGPWDSWIYSPTSHHVTQTRFYDDGSKSRVCLVYFNHKLKGMLMGWPVRRSLLGFGYVFFSRIRSQSGLLPVTSLELDFPPMDLSLESVWSALVTGWKTHWWINLFRETYWTLDLFSSLGSDLSQKARNSETNQMKSN